MYIVQKPLSVNEEGSNLSPDQIAQYVKTKEG